MTRQLLAYQGAVGTLDIKMAKHGSAIYEDGEAEDE